MPGERAETGPLLVIVAVASAVAVTLTVYVLVTMLGGVDRAAAPSGANVLSRPIAGANADERAIARSAPPMVDAIPAARPTPRWIWSDAPATSGQRAWFRTTVHVGSASRITLRFTCDNHAVVYANGQSIARVDDWTRPEEVDLPASPDADRLEIVVEAANDGGPAGLMAVLETLDDDGRQRWFVTNDTWEVADDASFTQPRRAVDLGSLGVDPWGALPSFFGADVDRAIRVRDGFAVDLVYAVPRSEGSWVSLTVDGQGRLIAGAEAGGLFRLTPPPIDAPPAAASVERIDVEIGGTQGLLCVGGDLFCVVNDPRGQGSGLYRLRDTDGDDRYDTGVLLRPMPGGSGEHGPHGVVLGPDGMLYVVAGNHTPLPDPERSAVPRVWGEDQLLPRLWDAGGHAVGIEAPGGWICRTGLDGAVWELVASGYRNPYDIAFNADGELFAFDADMEWDMGAPWYRPTRVNHATSGAEFGWRSGTGKWPPHYPDSLPATLDIGPGSPTGVLFGHGAAFPDRYRRALFLLDWTFGTIYAAHLDSAGAAYRGEKEVFLTGRPLPLTDAAVNPVDGAMYFAVGGRGAASALYRVRYTGLPPTASPEREPDAGAAARQTRRALEAWHRPDSPPEAIDAVWPALGDADRFVRYAARVGLEHQPPDRWAERILQEPGIRSRLTGLLALARVGGERWREPLLEALGELSRADLDRDERLELLRCWSLSFIRTGPPGASQSERLAAALEAMFPSGDDLLDRELCSMLVYLRSPTVVARTIALMERADDRPQPDVDEQLLSRSDTYGRVILEMAAAQPQRQQVHYALALREAERGWTPGLRERYFRWFANTGRSRGGRSFAGYLRAIRSDALSRIPEAERGRYEAIDVADAAGLDPRTLPRGPGRSWTVDGVMALAADGFTHRSLGRGQQLYVGARCAECHRFSGVGKMGGPDLTGVATRFSLRDLVEAVAEPSRSISDQYRDEEVLLTDGSVVLGRVMDESAGSLRIRPSLLAPDSTIEIAADRVRERRPSDVSPMMPYLLDGMAPGEVLDLLGYLLSEGDPRSPMFTPPGAAAFDELFDGESLDGWQGDHELWRVVDGDVVGRTTAAAPITGNRFLIWQGRLPEHFELRTHARLEGDNNSGIQYRSELDEARGVVGYQCDIHPNPAYDGMLYEEGGRGIVAEQGQRIRITPDGTRHAITPSRAALAFTPGAWHEYAIIVRGNRVEHRVDGTVACVVVDETGTSDRPRGRRLGLQLHAGAPYEVRFRDIRLRALPP